MADKKISQLNTATTPLVGTEVLPIVQGGQTVKTTVQAIANLSYQDITYSQLYNKVVNGQLVPGQWYRLTDYKSVNFLNGWTLAQNNPASGPNFNPREIYEGDEEVLILQATSPYEISEIGYSETFNGDVVTYWPYVNKIGVSISITNGNTLPDSTTVSGFDLQWDGTNVYFNMPTGYPALLGHYFYVYCEFDGGNYYQDGAFQPLTAGISVCQYPYTNDDPNYGYPKAMSRIRVENNGQKVVLIDLTQTDYNLYDANTLQVDTIYAIGDAYGWIVRRQDTQRNIDVPFDFRGRKYRRFEVNLSGINSAFGTYYFGQGNNYLGQGTTGNYRDYLCFGNNGQEVFNVTWLNQGGPELDGNVGFNDNNVFVGEVSNCIISDRFFNNTLLGPFASNITSGNFTGNSFSTAGCYYNNIACSVVNNICAGTFLGNTCPNKWFTLSSNRFTGSFSYNDVYANFLSNTVGANLDVLNNKFLQEFSSNTVSNGSAFTGQFNNNIFKIGIASLNFNTATHVYESYTCEIFMRSNLTTQLSYVSGTNVVTYAAVNA